MLTSVQKKLKEIVENNEITLFMKGSPEFPQCGFSGRTVQILQECGVPFTSIDVLGDNSLREGIKEYSNWPTIPQLYVRGQFIGGCDILKELYKNNELKQILQPEFND